jgi:short subunit dehydrogenase-like uncharacterized protein
MRDFDVVLYGASGFTGRLVAERLAERAGPGTRIALAGRSLAKLGAVRDALGERAAGWGLILADSGNRATLRAMARSTTALASTVGPYLEHGLPVVAACAREGTHYADITGEVLFMRATIDACHEGAARTGARIVHACGYDSLPSDLGVLVLHEAAGPLGDTTLLVRETKGGVSGGTLATMRVIMAETRSDPSAREMLADPYALSPDRAAEPDLGDESDLTSPHHDPDLGWLGPFVMGTVNTRVVRRSNALAGYPYSRSFRYREALGFGEGVAARAKATGLSAGIGALGAAMGFGPSRAGMERLLPKPGEGPSEDVRAAGYFHMQIHGLGLDGRRLIVEVSADGDPGYAATSLMLAESVLLLASDDADLPDRAGVLTPATGLGMPLVERLRAAGMTFRARPGDAGPDRGSPGPGGLDRDEPAGR